MTAFKCYAAKHKPKGHYANYSDLPVVSFIHLTHSKVSEGTNNCQQHSALSKMMPTHANSPCWSEN